jgi:prevent-host-death family protein
LDKIVGVTELQRDFRIVFDDVVEQKASYILTRGSRPEAVLISYKQCRQFVASNSDDFLAGIERLLSRMAFKNTPHDDAEVEADLKEAAHTLRQRKRA